MGLAENREAARVRALFHAEFREEELITRIAELQLDVHRLNNIINPIPYTVPINHEEAPSEEDQDDGIISNGESEEDICSLAMVSMLMYQFPSLYVMDL